MKSDQARAVCPECGRDLPDYYVQGVGVIERGGERQFVPGACHGHVRYGVINRSDGDEGA